MKILILTLWCLVPIGLLAYHYGPGKQGLSLDSTSELLEEARAHTTSGNPVKTIAALERALVALPKDRTHEAREIRLEIAKARMTNAGLPEAREELAALVEEINADPQAPATLRDDALASLASARFYMTYLMKLEGLPDSEWEPEIEAARQERKLLVQRATQAGNTAAATRHADDLESAIRLARMEPEELYGLAIPKQCSGCKSGKCNKPSQKPSQKPKDSRGAGAGAPMDGEGS
jgi:hypothetical protein